MNRIIFWSIFLLGLMNVVHCKKYLVEVADKQAGVTQGNGGVQQDQEEANDQLNVDTEEEMKKNGSKGFS